MNKNKKLIIAMISVIAIAGPLYYLMRHDSQKVSESDDSIIYSPPTREEEQAGDDRKDEIVQSENNKTNPSNVDVVITDASQYGDIIEVRAFAANLVEDGECNITISKNDILVERTVPANADASTTPCMTVTIPRSDFPEAGTWQVSVEYSSENRSGNTTKEVVIN